MIEAIGDLWTYPASCRVVTTNLVVMANNELVMGAGVALQAAERFPWLPRLMGKWVDSNRWWSSGPALFRKGPKLPDYDLICLPTKRHWKEKSDLELIVNGCKTIAKWNYRGQVAMTRPGCGFGGLAWPAVKRAICSILDDRFVILTPR